MTERQITLTEAVDVQARLHNELVWLESIQKDAPETLGAEIGRIIERRMAAFDELSARMATATIPAPADTAPYLPPEPTSEVPGEILPPATRG